MRNVIVCGAALALAACAPQAQKAAERALPAAPAPVKTDAPSGAYTLDKSHASLSFKVDHLGFAFYTARFLNWDAKLDLDTAQPSLSRVEAVIAPQSLTLDNPPAGFADMLRGAQWLDAKRYPQMTFRSTKVELTGPDSATITGDLTLHGVTKPVTLETRFNGGYPGLPTYDPNARIGFSAHGTFKRSDFAISTGIPAAGSKMGVSDEVQVAIEAEFTGPPLANASASPAAP